MIGRAGLVLDRRGIGSERDVAADIVRTRGVEADDVMFGLVLAEEMLAIGAG